MVGAYKNTLKEKAALESTLSALTSEAAAGGGDDDKEDFHDAEDGGSDGGGGADDNAKADGGSDIADAENADSGDASGAGTSSKPKARKSTGTGGSASSAELKAAKMKVATLAKALSTITEEKNIMEARFQKGKCVRVLAFNPTQVDMGTSRRIHAKCSSCIPPQKKPTERTG